MIKQAKQFFKVHREWLGEGVRPVGQALANARAGKCLQCPKHKEQPVLEALAGPAAKVLREIIAYKNHLELTVEREDELHTCGVCDCLLASKVWVPIGSIVAGTEPDDFAALPSYCWQVIESEAAK